MQLDGKVIQAAIVQLVDDYKFDPYQVIDIVKMGIRSAFRKDFQEYKKAEVVADIDDDGSISIYRQYEVVETVEDPETQIDLEQAQENSDFSFIDSRMRDEALSLESLLDYYPAALIPNDVSNNDQHWSDLEELNERIWKEIRTSGYELYNCFLKAG